MSGVTLDNGLDVPKNDFKRRWLGNPLYLVGIDPTAKHAGGYGDLRCRGEIVAYDALDICDDEAQFFLSTETAWVPMVKMWQEIIDKMGLKSVRFAFCADEPGCELFCIYDPDGTGWFDDVIIDCHREPEDEYSDDLKKLLDKLALNDDCYEYVPLCWFKLAVKEAFPDSKETAREIADRLTSENDYVSIRIADRITAGELEDFD